MPGIAEPSSTERDGLEPGRGATVQFHAGCADELFWCASGSAIWNNSGDTVFVLDSDGTIVTTCRS